MNEALERKTAAGSRRSRWGGKGVPKKCGLGGGGARDGRGSGAGAGRISSTRGGGNRKSRRLSAHAVGLRGVTGKCATSFWIVSIFSVH